MSQDHEQVRIRKWLEFKTLVKQKKPGSIVYVLEQNGFSQNKELTILRLIMLQDQRYYIFIDTPGEAALRETGIPFRKDKNGNRYLDEDDVTGYLKKEFEGENLSFRYFWTF
jgi:hypothetical protein